MALFGVAVVQAAAGGEVASIGNRSGLRNDSINNRIYMKPLLFLILLITVCRAEPHLPLGMKALPSAAEKGRGPLALVKDGDTIVIDGKGGKLTLNVSEAELTRRRKAWKLPKRERLSGALEKYAALVGPANLGAVTHSGGKK